ncbi:chaperone modulator CbpM [Martelella radicis]|uniref:Chaperone modulatory protein CbpM n=1 Tax=Martelella radicis TaxID=1397476 RepID=A0A7W6KHL1_9HYPH|nr:chaperone modulator CbpM [Martelella radicis]MBB4121230.1 chaperone modulatory protein CbpM [Martelella radicis]
MIIMTKTEVLERFGRLSAERLEICVTRSWVKPRQGERGPAFDETDLARLQLIVELTEDLEVNDEAVPVVLGLMDELNSLRRRMKALDRALNAEGEDVRAAVIKRLQERR